MSISRFFHKDAEKGCEYFIGNKLEIFISKRFEYHKCLKIGSSFVTIGIFDMIVDDQYEDSLFGTCLLEMEPSLIEEITVQNDVYVKATFYKGDIFIKNTLIQQLQELGFVVFYEVITQANRSKHLDYFKSVKIFDVLEEVAGVKFNLSRKTFELIMAHVHRDPKNIARFYRQTDMSEPPVIVAFRDIAHGTITTTGKIIGNYYTDSLRSAIVNPSTQSSELENIMRA